MQNPLLSKTPVFTDGHFRRPGRKCSVKVQGMGEHKERPDVG